MVEYEYQSSLERQVSVQSQAVPDRIRLAVHAYNAVGIRIYPAQFLSHQNVSLPYAGLVDLKVMDTSHRLCFRYVYKAQHQ